MEHQHSAGILLMFVKVTFLSLYRNINHILNIQNLPNRSFFFEMIKIFGQTYKKILVMKMYLFCLTLLNCILIMFGVSLPDNIA